MPAVDVDSLLYKSSFAKSSQEKNNKTLESLVEKKINLFMGDTVIPNHIRFDYIMFYKQ